MDYYENIKDYLIRNEINHRVKDYSKNKGDLETYYNVGKELVLAQGGERRAKYGDNLIKEYSNKLTKELGKGYTTTALKRMRKFYLLIEKGAPLAHQLSKSHYDEILILNDIDKIKYYIDLCVTKKMTKRELRNKIKNNEYEKLSDDIKEKLKAGNKLELIETVKNQILIDNPDNKNIYKEKILGDLIMENIDSFLSELGSGYYYVGREYKIKLGDKNNYIDFLLYNMEYESYVVIELKIGELKKEYIGQIEIYMNYVDKNIKKITHNKTIGIILCKKNNTLIVEYTSNPNIIAREYVIVGDNYV